LLQVLLVYWFFLWRLDCKGNDVKSTYRVLAYIIAIEVVIQAAAIAYAFFALGKWIDDGATLNKTLMDNPNATYPGTTGLAIHGLNGEMLMPLLVLALLVVSFFAKIPGGTKWAGYLLGLLVIQIGLAFAGHAAPAISPLHGINALILFSVAVMAGRRMSARAKVAPATQAS
jgi:hypothetical protein